MSAVHQISEHTCRTVWVSDIHLGTKDCKAEYLNDFLQSTHCEFLYLVGDIVDLWSMHKLTHWPASHSRVLRTILDKAGRGTQVFFIPGNHDETFREFDGLSFGNLHIRLEHIHTAADGRRLLILHGDKFDGVVKCQRLAHFIGNKGYGLIMGLARWVFYFRKRLGFSYWSLAVYVKSRIKNAVKHIREFEMAAAHEAKLQQTDGVVCGHIHSAEIRRIDGIDYMNDGDWVENCTALVERSDGSIELLHWSDQRKTVKRRYPQNVQEQPRVA